MSFTIKPLISRLKKNYDLFNILALTGAIRGTSKEKNLSRIGIVVLRDRRWCRKLCLLYKVLENEINICST